MEQAFADFGRREGDVRYLIKRRAARAAAVP